MPREKRVAIVGAGLAGLVAARQIASAGLFVVVLDKGRRPGGRMSSREQPEGLSFDHGAQYFTAREEAFIEEVRRWEASGVARRWSPRLAVRGPSGLEEKDSGAVERYLGVPSMRAVPIHLAGGLSVVSTVTVAHLESDGGRVRLLDSEKQALGVFDAVGLAPPAPQAASLLRDFSPDLAEKAASVEYAPTWAAMLAFDPPLDPAFPFDGVFVNVGPLSWIAHEGRKPGRAVDERFVVHAGAAFSSAHVERPEADVLPRLADAFFEAIELSPVKPAFARGHRWRYAFPLEPLEDGCVSDAARRVACAGDWTGGAARVEGAFRGGRALADTLLEMVR